MEAHVAGGARVVVGRHRNGNAVALGEGDREIEIDEEILKDLQVAGAGAERAVGGGSQHGHAPGGDVVGHADDDAGAAVAVGNDLGIDVERLGEVGACVRVGWSHGLLLLDEGGRVEILAIHLGHFDDGGSGGSHESAIKLAGHLLVEHATATATHCGGDSTYDSAHDTAADGVHIAAESHSVDGLHHDCFHGRADIQHGGEHGPIARFESHRARSDLEARRGHAKLVLARRQSGQRELPLGIRRRRARCASGVFARCDGGAGHRGSGGILHGTCDLGAAVEGAAVVLHLEIDGHLIGDGRPGDLARAHPHVGHQIVGGIEALVGARTAHQVVPL